MNTKTENKYSIQNTILQYTQNNKKSTKKTLKIRNDNS